MRVDALAVRLRPRKPLEAADLGVALCQHTARSVFTSYLAVALPLFVLCLATIEFSTWIPTFAIWMAKPWLDRSILFALSRAAFGQPTSPADVWRAQREVWWSQLLRTWTLRRLSPWRSLTGPVHQLEGLTGARLRKRIRQVRGGKTRSAVLITGAFSMAEFCLMLALLSLFGWFAPEGMQIDFMRVFDPELEREIQFVIALAYAVSVAVVEPFYVAAGFGLYLNRRVELEAWDLEQEFRRARPG